MTLAPLFMLRCLEMEYATQAYATKTATQTIIQQKYSRSIIRR